MFGNSLCPPPPPTPPPIHTHTPLPSHPRHPQPPPPKKKKKGGGGGERERERERKKRRLMTYSFVEQSSSFVRTVADWNKPEDTVVTAESGLSQHFHRQ